MDRFQRIEANDFDRIFDRIGKEWMLISASDGARTNTMTASWGCCGVLWNKPVIVCFVRPQRYTCPIIEAAERISFSFLGEEYRNALIYCGRHSGRDGDKFLAAGLRCADWNGVPYPAEAQTVLIGRRLYTDTLRKEAFADTSLLSHYTGDDLHRIYACEIEAVMQHI